MSRNVIVRNIFPGHATQSGFKFQTISSSEWTLRYYLDFITGAQPKAGTGHKKQSISVVFSTLHCEGDIADLRYRWLITSGSARWLSEILSAILKSTRHGGQSTERLYLFGEQHAPQPLRCTSL